MGFFSKLFGKKDVLVDSVLLKQKNEGNFKASENHPTVNKEYALTIFLWAHQKASPVRRKEEYARYFAYDCGINDPEAYHHYLISKGYFEQASTEEMLSTLKVDDIKRMLKENGLSTTGKKADLINRATSEIDEKTLQSRFNQPHYVLSSLGNEFLENHSDYILLHKHGSWGIDWKEYDANHYPGCSFYDTVWAILNKRVLEDNHNFGRNEYYFMYQLLAEEKKRKRALEMLLRVLFVDLSGSCAIGSFTLYNDGYLSKKELEESFGIAIMLAPGIVHPIAEYKDVYTDSVIDRLYEQSLPIQVCEKELFRDIVESIINGSFDETIAEVKLRKAFYRYVGQMK